MRHLTEMEIKIWSDVEKARNNQGVQRFVGHYDIKTDEEVWGESLSSFFDRVQRGEKVSDYDDVYVFVDGVFITNKIITYNREDMLLI